MRDDGVGGEPVEVAGDPGHGTGEYALEDQHEDARGGDTSNRERGAATVLEQVPAGGYAPVHHDPW